MTEENIKIINEKPLPTSNRKDGRHSLVLSYNNEKVGDILIDKKYSIKEDPRIFIKAPEVLLKTFSKEYGLEELTVLSRKTYLEMIKNNK